MATATAAFESSDSYFLTRVLHGALNRHQGNGGIQISQQTDGTEAFPEKRASSAKPNHYQQFLVKNSMRRWLGRIPDRKAAYSEFHIGCTILSTAGYGAIDMSSYSNVKCTHVH
jgi:hypothetical protein